jgi:hypothetical protein
MCLIQCNLQNYAIPILIIQNTNYSQMDIHYLKTNT